MTFTRTEDSPFKNTSVLAEDFIPDKVLGRQKELEQIEEVFQQIVDVEEPVNAFIYGISGTGKTVSIKFKQRELENSLQAYDDVNATFIYQNCESLNSSYQAAIAIANSFLNDPEYEFLHERLDISRRVLPSSGLPKERVYRILFTIFDSLTYRNTEYRARINSALDQAEDISSSVSARVLLDNPDTLGTQESDRILSKLEEEYDIRSPDDVTDYVTVILDEVDRIGTRDELLYEIPRSRMNNRVENIRPSVIGISNDIGYKESIQSKTDSSLRLKEITFKKYDVAQLTKILEQRAEKAFNDGAYEQIVDLAAAYARKEGGDARYGIDLLYKAGMKAKKQGDSVVREQHVREAHEEHERDRVYEVTADLGDHEKLVLAGVMYHDLKGETPVARAELYPTYQRFSHAVLNDKNGSRRVADYLKRMSQLGLLHRKDVHEGPGESGFVYTLEKVDYDMIMHVLRDSTPVGQSADPDDLVPEELVTAFNELATEDHEESQTTVGNWDS
ncbi:MAG: Cdc6/Cdc18 family protein [Halobacteriaceae archaeon]